MNINKWLLDSQFFLLPGVCVLCGEPSRQARDLCTACVPELPRHPPACVRCARILPAETLESLCGRCQVSPPAFQHTLSIYTYAHPVDFLLQQLKFHNRLEMARILGELMGEALAEILDVYPQQLIPVPLHADRLRERGFNQASVLGQVLARKFGLPMNLDQCRRIRTTDSQSGLSRRARIRNMQGAFQVEGRIQGHVVIVDDVMTTGSTVNELAKALVKAGADRVDVWVCARA